MSETKRVRIIDIAEELGVSTATVSNVIHGKTKKISKETVKRVEKLLEEREYIPNMAGILLARNDSGIVGVVIHNHPKYEDHLLQDPFIAASLDGLSAEIEKQKLFMMIKTTRDINEVIKFATMWNLVGLVVIGFCEQDYDELRSRMRIPFVVYDGMFKESRSRICNISIDDFDGGYQMGKHFARNHKKILCISDNKESMDLKRYEGFAHALSEHGSCPDFMLIPLQHDERIAFYRQNKDCFNRHTAVFAMSDVYAVELMQFLQSEGYRIPEDMAVAGFDDAPICTKVCPALTTIRQDPSARARKAIEILLGLKNKDDMPAQIMLPVELVIRGSA